MTSFTSYMALLGDTLIENGYRILPIIPGKKAPGRFEPRRVCRRLFGLSHAAMVRSSAWA
jgi:hypothetical protein